MVVNIRSLILAIVSRDGIYVKHIRMLTEDIKLKNRAQKMEKNKPTDKEYWAIDAPLKSRFRNCLGVSSADTLVGTVSGYWA